MTFKSEMDHARDELAKLEEEMLRAKLATGAIKMILVNDPEDPTMLEPYRQTLDQTKCFSIGPPEFPGGDWYREYQEASRAGDAERTHDLLQRGRAAMRTAPGPQTR
jgi:hypothetical protein